MTIYSNHQVNVGVTLLAEGVDRNFSSGQCISSRHVTLLAEGVDRNTLALSPSYRRPSHPPRGGCG